MEDETKLKIVNAAFQLISEKGYTATTTKDISKLAGVNEVTLFRKFENKKGIFIYAFKELQWFGRVDDEILIQCTFDLEKDLIMFSDYYFKLINLEYVKIAIGLKDTQIFPDLKDYIINIPNSFKQMLIKYFKTMYEKNKINSYKFEILAGMFISINFGFIFMKASFHEEFIHISIEKYIEESIKVFTKGINV